MEDSWKTVIAASGCDLTAAFMASKSDPRMAEVAQDLAAIDVHTLASHLVTPMGRAKLRWCLSTSEGRAWLGLTAETPTGAEPPARAVRDREILKWAFAAELRQLKIPPEQAVSFVNQGITLRDIKSKSVDELTRQRLALVKAMRPDEMSPATIASTLQDTSLKGYLEEQWRDNRRVEQPSSAWLESQAKAWLDREFQRLKDELELTELVLVGIPLREVAGLLEQGITLSELRSKSSRELATAFLSGATADGASVTQAIEGFIGADQLRAELEQAGEEKELGNVIRRWEPDQVWQWHDAQSKRVLLRELDQCRRDVENADKAGQDIFSVGFYDVLVVSDFHLAAGNRPSTDGIARLSPTEDFFFDDAFFRFLHYCDAERRDREGFPYELIFNGDMIDFAQVVVSDGAEDRPLEPWTLPPLWLHQEASESESDPDGERESPERLPNRMRAILDAVYGKEVVGRAVGRGPGGSPAADQSGEDWEDWYGDWIERAAKRPAKWTQEQWEQWAYDIPPVEEWRDRAGGDWATHMEQARAQRAARGRRIHVTSRSVALYQLADVYFGHRRLFQGLAWFLAQGNRLVVIRGNHDPQLYWPEVQLAFIGWLKTAYDDLRRECAEPAKCELPVDAGALRSLLPETSVGDFEARVDFHHSWYYYRERLVYLEHGGQHDAMNSHRYFLRPLWPPWRGLAAGYSHGGPFSGLPEPTRESHKIQQRSGPLEAGNGSLDRESQAFVSSVEGWLSDLEVDSEAREIDAAWGNVGLNLVNVLENEFPNFERPGYQKVYLQWLLYRRPGLLLRKLIPALLRTLLGWMRWAVGTLRGFQEFVPGGPRSDYDSTALKAYAGLTGLPHALVLELDRTQWVKLWRCPGSGLLYVLLNILVFAVLGCLIVLGLGELLGFFSVYKELASRLPFLAGLLEQSSGGTYVFKDLLLDLVATFVVGLATYWLITAIRRFVNLQEDYLFEPAQRVAGILHRGWDVPYLLFGHDHAHNAQPLSVGASCSDENCVKELRKRDVRLEAKYHLETEAIECDKCGARVDPQDLQREVDRVLSQVGAPQRYVMRCRSCQQENSIDTTSVPNAEPALCKECGAELSNDNMESLPWTYLKEFGIDSLHCKCGEPLPNALVESIKLYPPHFVLTCPQCLRTEQQWLGTWSLGCPDCGRSPRKRDVRIVENQAIIHCRCGLHYPTLQRVNRWYLNTGTWMHMFATERKRLVREALEYPFVRMIDTHRVLAAGLGEHMQASPQTRPRVQLLRWNDNAGRVESCETFRGTDEDRWPSRSEIKRE